MSHATHFLVSRFLSPLDPEQLDTLALAQAVEHAGYKIPREARELAISGMTCATCAGRIEAVLKRVSGVTWAEVNLANERASVELLWRNSSKPH